MDFPHYKVCCAVILIITNTIPVNSDRIVDNFNDFSSHLDQTSYLTSEASETRPGIHLFNPFGVGLSLANIHEGLWDISTKNVSSTLRTVEKYVSDDYNHLSNIFKKEKFKITSTIYSRFGNMSHTQLQSISKLMSHVITVDYVNNPAKFVDSFSSIMDSGTKRQLDNELLPKGLWQKVFDNYTQGAYINTMYYKAKHEEPWVEIGPKKFNFETAIPFLEVKGEFPIFQNENFTAVIVDLKQIPPKKIVFAKGHTSMKISQLQAELRTMLKNSLNKSFVKKQLRVQVPVLNVTNLSRHNLGLTLMGISETFCNINESMPGATGVRDFVQQPITQGNHFELAPEYIEIASATGSIVSLNTGDRDLDLEEEYDDDDLSSIIVNDDYEDLDLETEITEPLLRTNIRLDQHQLSGTKSKSPAFSSLHYILNKLKLKRPAETPLTYAFQGRGRKEKVDNIKNSQKCASHVKVSGAGPAPRQLSVADTGKYDSENMTALIFDTPFAFIFVDEVLGETFSGFISSLCTYNKVIQAMQTNPVHQWMMDVFKVAFWKCY